MIEQLRFGVPPPDRVRHFTVGRDAQLRQLAETLERDSGGHGLALLVRANYGSGKSHLLKVIREMALEARYAVSLVIVDANSGVRFNRMDQILGSICRSMETPGSTMKGVDGLFDTFKQARPSSVSPDLARARERISSSGRWDFSDFLSSPAIHVALRAWIKGRADSIRHLVVDWLGHPENYRGQRKKLYLELVGNLRSAFRDLRSEWQYYAENVFAFHTDGHRQAWGALADFDLLARASGLRGLVLLFDEFEDVIHNLNRRDYKEMAFLNLFRFFEGEKFPGRSYFAVTPDFVAKCKDELLRRTVYDFDYKRFDRLPFFEMDPITLREFEVLAKRIREIHDLAYSDGGSPAEDDTEFERQVKTLWIPSSPERVRTAIKGLVDWLDGQVD